MKNKVATILVCFLIQINLYAQCTCNNCVYSIPPFGTGTSTLTISGATNNTLGQNGQRLRAVRVNFFHQAIREVTVRLFPPNNQNPVTLMLACGCCTPRNIDFDICFIDCSETYTPFPSSFNNCDNFTPNSFYNAVHYPNSGCLSDFTGSVNGTWTLEFVDNIPFDGGTLFQWNLEFEDNNGTGCEYLCVQGNTNTCQANGGEFTPIIVNACEGDATLDLNISISFGGNTPDPNLYSYYYIITDQNGVILDINPNSDLTAYAPGTYNVCGLSILTADFSLVPTPNGSLTISDIEADIGNDLYCADLSLNCWQVVIEPNVVIPAPIISGPLEVCAGVPVTYTIENYDPNFIYRVVQGTSAFFVFVDEIIFTFLSGPTTICIQALTNCSESIEVCLTIEVLDPNIDIVINGPLDVCPNVDYNYTLSPALLPGTSWSINVTGGTLVNQSGNDLTIQWSANGGNNLVSATLIDGPCGDVGPVELNVNVFDYTLPTSLNSTSPLCIGSTGQSGITANSQITNYIWSGTGITITSGQGTAGPISYTVDQIGNVEVCLEVETTCGNIGPVCETINVLAIPMPTIDPVSPTCDLEFTLTGNIDPSSSASWQIISGPNGGNIITPNSSTTNVQVTQSGIYVIQLTENNGTCSGTTSISVEVFESPVVSNISFDCLGAADEYVATITISGGQPPYTVNGDLATGNTYTFASTAGGNSIPVTVTDDNGCETSLNITHDCPCISNAGTMSTQTINSCISSGVSVFGIHNGNATLDNNDIGVYVLHTGTGTTLGTIIEINTTGIFDFQTGITPGVTYYISFVVGNELGGSIDLNDRCLSVAVGQPVIFFEDPTIFITSPNTFCPPTGFLEASIVGDFTSVLWTQISGPNNSTIINPNNLLTNVNFPQSGTYQFEITVTNGPCSVSQSIEIEILSLPQISNITDNCNGANEFTLTFDISDPSEVSSISLSGSLNGNTFTSDPLIPTTIYNIILTLTNGCELNFSVGPVDCDCINRSGTMSNIQLSACISSGDVVEATYNNDGAFQTGDIGLYYLHDNPGTTLGFVYDINATGEFTFQAGMLSGVTYFISNVVGQELGGIIDLNDSCLKVSNGQPVVFYDDPILNYIFESEVCGLNAQLRTIINPILENVEWKFISGDGLSEIENPGSEITDITVSDAGLYTFEINVNNLACSTSEEFTISFFETLMVDSISTQCVQSNAFQLTFTINGDANSMTVSIPGNFDNNRFTSETLISDSLYNVVLTDLNGCTSTFNVGPINCNCLSAQGTMRLDIIQLCETSGSITIGFNDDAVLFPGDSSVFVIHQGRLDSLINPIFITDTINFGIPNILNRNQLYYVSHVVSSISNDTIDFQSECLRVSQGQPLIVYSEPNFVLPEDIENCLENISVFIENANNGSFEIISNTTGSNVDINFVGDSLFINPTGATALSISYEERNGACLRRDTFDILFNSLPLATNVRTNCTGESFVASFDMSGGLAPYFVNGNPIAANNYESPSVASETQLIFSLSDANGCTSESFDITANCSCPGNAGIFNPNTPISLCERENIDLSGTRLDGFIDDIDLNLYYVLHDGNANTIGNIIALTTQNTINWVPTIETNRTYFITAVLSSGTDLTINFSDPCIDISEGIPVVWNDGPIVAINGETELCSVEELSIEIQSNGPFPFSIILTNDRGTTTNAFEITQSNQSITLPTILGEMIWSIANVTSSCTGTFSGTFISRVAEPQNVIFNTSATVCNNRIFGSSIDLNSLLAIPNIVGVWLYQGNEVVDGIFDFNGFLPNNYTFTFDTRGLENPCEGDVYTTSIEVIECLCPPVTLPDSLSFCASTGRYQLSNLEEISAAGNWSILNPNNHSLVPNIIENNLFFDNNVNGIFQLVFTITDEVPDECDKEFVVTLDIEGALSAGRLAQESTAFCDNLAEIVDLSTLIELASPGGAWFGLNGILSNTNLQVTSLNIGLNTYFYRLEAGIVCPADEIEVTINIVPSPEYIIETEDPKCPEENFGSISILPINDPNLSVFLNRNPVSDVNLSMLPPGRYIIEVFNLGGCSGGEEIIDILPAPTYSTDIGEDIIVTINTSVELKLETEIPDSLLLSISWEDENGIFNTSDRSVLYLVEGPTEIRVIITTIDGCVYERTLKINTRIPAIVMPNIFNPNGSGTNTTFGPVGVTGDILVKEFNIYDRWGNLVHSQKNKNISDNDLFWNGRFNGADVQPGVFVYYLVLEESGSNQNILKGDITVVR